MMTPEETREYYRKYSITHKKEIQAKRHQSYEKNKEKILAQQKQWRLEHPEEFKIRWKKQNASLSAKGKR